MNLPYLLPLASAALACLASCATPAPKETDRDLFLKTDVNKDRKLSLDEVNRAALPRLFGHFDLNGDGSVTFAETRQVDPDFPEPAYKERDLNKDGKVTYAESEKMALKQGGVKKAFGEVDHNRDGFIDKPEAEAHVDRFEKAAAPH